jgi:hypothetical protein
MNRTFFKNNFQRTKFNKLHNAILFYICRIYTNLVKLHFWSGSSAQVLLICFVVVVFLTAYLLLCFQLAGLALNVKKKMPREQQNISDQSERNNNTSLPGKGKKKSHFSFSKLLDLRGILTKKSLSTEHRGECFRSQIWSAHLFKIFFHLYSSSKNLRFLK